jgi:signal transduction histidine kinase
MRSLVQFEALLNDFLPSEPACCLCVYDRRAWPAAVIRDVLRTHQVAVVNDLVCRNNPFYERPGMVLTSQTAEERVGWMLERLRDTRCLELTLEEAIRVSEDSRRQALNLIEDSLRSQEALRQSEADAQLLRALGSELVAQGNPQVIYDKVIDAAVAIMGARFASMQLFHPERGAAGELRLLAHRGFGPAAAKFWEWVRADSSCTCGMVLKTRQRCIEPDIANSSFMTGTDDQASYLREGILAGQSTPLTSRDGNLLGMISTYWDRPYEPSERELRNLDILARQAADLIERNQADAALRAMNATLQETNRQKDEFLAMLGHELRNPLYAVRNAVAAASLDGSRRPRALDIARRQTEQLGRLIDDLLDVARITQGRIPLRKERVYLRDLLTRAMDDTRSFIESRGLRCEMVLPPTPMRLDGDPSRLEQVFVNLLSNAGKFTEPGGAITVEATLERGQAVVRVRDTGIGIAPEFLPRIWDLFAQAERSLDRAQGGLGIGLTVARRLVELHGGHMVARSRGLGQGAEFAVSLPAIAGTAEEPAVASEPQFERTRDAARVLIVEDNPDAAEGLAMILELLGHRIRIVPDGIGALGAAKANPPDVMLVDIGLPGMDGYELARRIRRDPALKHLVLVALTGYGREEDKDRSIRAGFDCHLVKPVALDALSDLNRSPS